MSLRWFYAIGEMSIDLVELFERLGINTVGDLAALDQRDVLGRFGLPGCGHTGSQPALMNAHSRRLSHRNYQNVNAALMNPFLRSHQWCSPPANWLQSWYTNFRLKVWCVLA